VQRGGVERFQFPGLSAIAGSSKVSLDEQGYTAIFAQGDWNAFISVRRVADPFAGMDRTGLRSG
jgi:hypothetical protein